MPTYAQMPVRLQATLISQPTVNPVDSNTGQPVEFWRATDLNIGVGVFDSSGNAVDLSNLTSLTLSIFADSTYGALLATTTVLASAIIPVISMADWLAGINQQASFVFTAAQTDLNLGGQTSATLWMQLQGKTGAGAVIAYATGSCSCFAYNAPGQLPTAVSEDEQTLSVGNATVTPGSQIHTEEITVSPSLATGTHQVILGTNGIIPGAQLDLIFDLPTTGGPQGVIISCVSGALGGTVVQQFTVPGIVQIPSARLSCFFKTSTQTWVAKFYQGPEF